MSKVRSFVALDVHVAATVAAVLDADSGELRRQRLSGRTGEVVEFVTGLEGPVRATYEAGPTGFALARRLQAAGVDRASRTARTPAASQTNKKTPLSGAFRAAHLTKRRPYQL